jgi:hypothetical protein
MSLSKSKCLYSNNFLQFLKCAVPLHYNPSKAVFPDSRTARFGSALLMKHPGSIALKSTKFRTDFRPIDDACDCSTCKTVARLAAEKTEP